jgi:hypothetical protein
MRPSADFAKLSCTISSSLIIGTPFPREETGRSGQRVFPLQSAPLHVYQSKKYVFYARNPVLSRNGAFRRGYHPINLANSRSIEVQFNPLQIE